MINQFGSLLNGNINAIGLTAAVVLLTLIMYMVFFKKYKETANLTGIRA